jgi:arsenite/tail-anchored protein-transporting ATPase
MKAVRPIARRLSDVPMPDDSYFASLQDLFRKLDGVDQVLLDRETTTIRLVTNAEKMVVRETQRAFMYFCLYGLVVDSVIVNKLFPRDLKDEFFRDWLQTQNRSLEHIKAIFGSIPIRPLEILKDEVIGKERLDEMGHMIYGGEDPSLIYHQEKLYEIEHEPQGYVLRLKLPFIKKDHVDLFKENGDLVIRIGSFKRHVFLPRAIADKQPKNATLENDTLTINFAKDYNK